MNKLPPPTHTATSTTNKASCIWGNMDGMFVVNTGFQKLSAHSVSHISSSNISSLSYFRISPRGNQAEEVRHFFFFQTCQRKGLEVPRHGSRKQDSCSQNSWKMLLGWPGTVETNLEVK